MTISPKKTLLIISAGIEAVKGIKIAKEMGLYVIVSDKNPQAPGFKFADDKIIASTYHPDETLAAVKKYVRRKRKIDGVMTIACDAPLTVSIVAAELSLPGNSIKTSKLAQNKLLMKEKFKKDGLPIPWFSELKNAHQLKTLFKKQNKRLVIKPIDSRGGRGVLMITPQVGPDWAFAYTQSFSPTQRVLVEEYLPGPQVSTEGLIYDEQSFIPGLIDRNYEFLERFAPHFIENGGEQPSRLEEKIQNDAKKITILAGRSLGIKRGTVKGDIVIHNGQAKVIEIASRLSGGYMSTDQIPLATGVNLIEETIKLSLGEKPNFKKLLPQYQKGVAIRYFFPKPGRIVKIENLKKAKKNPWVYKIGLHYKRGEIFREVTDHTKRAGFVITIGKNREEAIYRAQQIIETVNIITSNQ